MKIGDRLKFNECLPLTNSGRLKKYVRINKYERRGSSEHIYNLDGGSEVTINRIKKNTITEGIYVGFNYKKLKRIYDSSWKRIDNKHKLDKVIIVATSDNRRFYVPYDNILKLNLSDTIELL